MQDNSFERRRDDRRYALKFLDYEVLDRDGRVCGRGLARTLNVSENGLRLEAGEFFDPGTRLRITLGLESDLVQAIGQVMHAEPVDDDLSSAGVMFLEFAEKERSLYSRHFEEMKKALAD
ncbi:MAG: PilZ domain-containing protein [Desulfuromonadales bacterium]|nr:PilZ domain-containing protein [Desulfuromonadales bacterium]